MRKINYEMNTDDVLSTYINPIKIFSSAMLGAAKCLVAALLYLAVSFCFPLLLMADDVVAPSGQNDQGRTAIRKFTDSPSSSNIIKLPLGLGRSSVLLATPTDGKTTLPLIQWKILS